MLDLFRPMRLACVPAVALFHPRSVKSYIPLVLLGIWGCSGTESPQPDSSEGSGGLPSDVSSGGNSDVFGSGGNDTQLGSGGTASGGAGGSDPSGGSGGIDDSAAGGAAAGGSFSGGASSGGAGSGGAAPLGPITIYVAGDSTVSTYADTASPSDQAGWGQMLHEVFDERVTVVNRAAGGRTALWFHLEGAAQWILDRIKPGDYWFVQFGTNDSHTTATFEVGGKTYQRFAAADGAFKEHLKEYYIEPARAKQATVVLVTPPPRNSAYCGKGNSLGGYAQAMRELGAAEDVIVLDNNQRTFDHLTALCPAPTPENFFFLRADNTVDGTHFQENGARHMAGFLADEMIEQSAGPYLYLLP